jgi:phosphate transport system permease protein
MSEIETQTKPTQVQKSGSHLRFHKRKAMDRLAAGIVRLGGGMIILSILGIMLFLLKEVLPLWRGARVEPVHTFVLQTDAGLPLAVGLDEYQKMAYTVWADGRIEFLSLDGGETVQQERIELPVGVQLTAVWQSLRLDRLALATSNGHVIEIQIDFGARFVEGGRSYAPAVAETGRLQLDPEGRRIASLAYAGDMEEALTAVGLTADGRVRVLRQSVATSLFGPAEPTVSLYDLTDQLVGTPTAVAVDGLLENLYVGTSDGRLIHFELPEGEAPSRVAVVQAVPSGEVITTLGFLIGDRSLVVGDAAGGVNVWFRVRDETAPTDWRLRKIHPLQSHAAAVTAVAVSARNKGLLSADESGAVFVQFATTERTLATADVASEPLLRLAFAPKANGFLGVDRSGRLHHWAVDNPHPEASWKAFFGKIWYEGYDEPAYVWQSTGGTDDFEPKLSMVPLIWGTLKGTFYSLIIAVPLAILAALYTSQFMHPRWRSRIKPAIEIMAALPSVVLGFLAGLWLAPLVAQYFPGLLASMLFLPPVILLASALWRALPNGLRGRLGDGTEVWLLMPIIVAVVIAGLNLNDLFSQLFFGGDFKAWLFESLGWQYDPRNALVVGFAMGFAVIPIIYTISEDALSNVPSHLVAGSLALGATRWQTAIRVVLPTASAGIFSAVMIGFGRAVGETMIMLMATGNTPIMDWNLFNGFRTLSANIAVEIPEAPVGGTLYRVLFLSAVLLFAMTFVVNTAAEVVRQRVRQRYGRL